MFMDNVDYPAWSKYLIQLLKEYQVEDGLVLDLGCGTGNMTELLAKEGYDMIGIDNSEEMLAEAMEKRAESGHDIQMCIRDRDMIVYGNICLKPFPKHERYALASEIRLCMYRILGIVIETNHKHYKKTTLTCLLYTSKNSLPAV